MILYLTNAPSEILALRSVIEGLPADFPAVRAADASAAAGPPDLAGVEVGVLSLLLNDSDPANRYALEEQSAAPYFRRERAADLVSLFESRFPNSSQRAELRERVIDAYAVYGSSDGVIGSAGAGILNGPLSTSSNFGATATDSASGFGASRIACPVFASASPPLSLLIRHRRPTQIRCWLRRTPDRSLRLRPKETFPEVSRRERAGRPRSPPRSRRDRSSAGTPSRWR